MNENSKGPLLVGFGHRRRVGKDTLANRVRDELNRMGTRAYRDAFAWKLKDTARKLFDYAGLGRADLYDHEPERREEMLPAIGMSPRDLWIAYGQKMREIASDVWIRNVLDNPAYGDDCVLLISDVRFANEVAAIRERGGLVVKVTRSDVPDSDDPADSALAGMPDEKWDRVVRNNLDMGFLEQQALWLAAGIRDRMRERKYRAG